MINQQYRGLAAAPGIAYGQAWVLDRHASEQSPPPTQPFIVVAEDVTAAELSLFDKRLLLGIVTLGSTPAQMSVLARAFGVPAVVNAPIKYEEVSAGITLIVDGTTGAVTLNPGAHQLASAKDKRERWLDREAQHRSHALAPATTTDGEPIEIVANIGGVDDARQALEYGAEGVGLFRTEYFFLDRDSLPSEDEQYAVYRAVVEVMGERPLVIRTLDIGGDKAVPYLGFAEEQNPFLGWRAFRMINEHPDVFEAQLRAILRAGVGADLRIMIPMIASIEEVRRARGLLEQVRDDLRRERIPQAERVQFGIMIEVPSAALIAHQLAPLVDFFSIGTNDLTQYTLAVDRTNPRVAALADTFHPAVLMLIQQTIHAAHARGKWVSLCGEFAGNPLAAPLLLGMGLGKFSMACASIPSVKAAIRTLSIAECKTFAQQALAFGTAAEIKAACEAYMQAVV